MPSDMLRYIDERVLDELASTIRSGDCVAFVGAGFSADGNGPSWREMVSRIIDELEADGTIVKERAATARKYVDQGEYDDAASVAVDSLPAGDHANVEAILNQMLTPPSRTKRDELLAEVPFKAVLTTNYDGRPGFRDRDAGAYREILRGEGTVDSWAAESAYGVDGMRRAVAIHGQLIEPGGPPLVLTRREYRSLLYRTPGFQTFLRSLFATTTVLFLGKSFGDEYLNELRSEVLALIGDDRLERPLAYAAVAASEFDKVQEEHLRETEGIQLLRYGSQEEKPDYDGFDALLSEIHGRTNFYRVMQLSLEGRRLLWLDTNPDGSWGDADVTRVMDRILDGHPGITIDRCSDVEEALDRASGYDFIISNWGYRTTDDAEALDLLDGLHDQRIRIPVLVFAAPGHDDKNRAAAVAAGAFAFETQYEALYKRIYQLSELSRA